MHKYGDENLTDEEVEQVCKERYDSETRGPTTLEGAKIVKQRLKKIYEYSIKEFLRQGRYKDAERDKRKLKELMECPLEDIIMK
ncbi:MAG: hypothetical protein Q4A55_06175 [Aerococcus sp.]|nr:hypothetical protein [Aerococcus sp.]